MNEKASANEELKPENKSSPKKATQNESSKSRPKSSTKRVSKRKPKEAKASSNRTNADYPRHDIEKVLRIPRAILDQNAGRNCSEEESSRFVGVGFHGPYRLEVSSALKYGLLNRPTPGSVAVTERAKQILRPQKPNDELEGLRAAILDAPVIADVYTHYRGENLPDSNFFTNALVDKFGIPAEKVSEFTSIFLASLRQAKLIDESNEKTRVLDVSHEKGNEGVSNQFGITKSSNVTIGATDTCFVMQPFASPLGDYYAKIYEPAIEKAGLKAVRADADIFGTGKIIDQIWSGINSARVLVAELTSRNPNVFYELGLAHALEKPVVLVSSNEDDVPFDLQHIRVIYYDVHDPFWGSKLIDKVAENIVSALENPEEAVLRRITG